MKKPRFLYLAAATIPLFSLMAACGDDEKQQEMSSLSTPPYADVSALYVIDDNNADIHSIASLLKVATILLKEILHPSVIKNRGAITDKYVRMQLT